MTRRIPRPVCAEYMTGSQERTISRRLHGGKGTDMPDHEDLERRLWRTMQWGADVMVPSEEQDEKDEQEGDGD